MESDIYEGQGQRPASRIQEFGGGIVGGGTTHIAGTLPEVNQAPASFDASGSVLMAANQFSGVGLGSSNSTVRINNAYGAMMRDQLKESGNGTIQQ